MYQKDTLDTESPDSPLVAVSTAARFLGVSRELLYREIRSGQIPAVRMSKSVRLRKEVVRAIASGADASFLHEIHRKILRGE